MRSARLAKAQPSLVHQPTPPIPSASRAPELATTSLDLLFVLGVLAGFIKGAVSGIMQASQDRLNFSADSFAKLCMPSIAGPGVSPAF